MINNNFNSKPLWKIFQNIILHFYPSSVKGLNYFFKIRKIINFFSPKSNSLKPFFKL